MAALTLGLFSKAFIACIKSLFPHKDRINRSQLSKVVYKASCWDCQDFYVGKAKRRLHDRKTEHFKAITSSSHASAVATHVTPTGHNLKWGHFDISTQGRSDTHFKIKGNPPKSGSSPCPRGLWPQDQRKAKKLRRFFSHNRVKS